LDKQDYKNDYVILYVYYETLDTEIQSETWMVDFISLLSNIGGNLGLFLGFSCLSTLLSVLECAKEKIWNENANKIDS